MFRKWCLIAVWLVLFPVGLLMGEGWEPPSEVSREKIVKASRDVFAMPDIELDIREDIIRIEALGMQWDIGGNVYEPRDAARIPRGPDGRKVGLFLIHGGGGDHRSKDPEARLLARKFGFKVVTMSYPGRIYLLDPSRNWPGGSIHPDGSVRTPIWSRDTLITRDQYEVVEETSMRKKYGTIIQACAKEGTEFYHRMAAWPAAFEEGGKAFMQRHLPSDEYTIYIHGHSTGGPFSFMLSQRVPNIAGVVGMDNSPFGYIFRVQSRSSGNLDGRQYGDLPFNCLHIRTWRDRARYAGPEALAEEGPEALMRLPSLMEDVLQSDGDTPIGGFKAEGPIHFGSRHQLANMARVNARRLNLTPEKTEAMIEHFVGYAMELSGKGVKPVPPVIFGIAAVSFDHTPEKYIQVTLPMYAGMNPPPKVRLVQFKAGIHGYTRPEPDLPMGPFPAVAKLWHDAIMGGYYADYSKNWAMGR